MGSWLQWLKGRTPTAVDLRNASSGAPELPPQFQHQTGVKLHLGCGGNYLKGYINIDAYDGAKADLLLDFREIGRTFQPGCAQEILMIHSIGYLNLWEARDLFKTAASLLEPGGKIILECPDIEKCARKFLQAAETQRFSPEYLEGVRGFYAFGLDDMEKRNRYSPYAFGWTDWHLREELVAAGFREAVSEPPQTHGRAWRDLRVVATR